MTTKLVLGLLLTLIVGSLAIPYGVRPFYGRVRPYRMSRPSFRSFGGRRMSPWNDNYDFGNYGNYGNYDYYDRDYGDYGSYGNYDYRDFGDRGDRRYRGSFRSGGPFY